METSLPDEPNASSLPVLTFTAERQKQREELLAAAEKMGISPAAQ